MKHFKLTAETKVFYGITLYRIEATQDLPQHYVKKGDKGGFVEKESNLSDSAWVSDEALVSGEALVCGQARVYGNAQVSGQALVSGEAQVYDDAHIDCASAILWITLGGFYTATITRKLIFIGCQKFTRKELKELKKEDAIKRGLPKEFANRYRKMILAALELVKENE